MSTESIVIRVAKTIEPVHLDKISEMMACMTVSSALLFPSRLDMSRFETALNLLVEHFPWLVCHVGTNEAGDHSVIPRLNEDGIAYMCCEVDDRGAKQYSDDIIVGTLLPKDVHEKMVRVDLAMASAADLPICALRVTQFAEHFVIGYRLNHLFFDQNSIVYLFTFLGYLYSQTHPALSTEGEGTPAVPAVAAPEFLPRAHITTDFTLSAEDFPTSAPKGYMAAPMPELSFGPPISVKLSINSEKIAALRKSVGVKLSTNDLLHAVMAKAIAGKDGGVDGPVRVCFARNMRTPLGLGRGVAGDYVRLEVFQMDAAQATTASLEDLAGNNRTLVETPIGEAYVKECAWFLDLHKYHDGRPNVDFLMDKGAAVVTNWSSFPYEEILFDGIATTELLLENTPMMTHNGAFARVSFRGAGKDRKLFAVVDSLNQYVIDNVRAIGAETGLFSCD